MLLSIPYSVRALGVRTGYPYYADVVITGMQIYIHIATCSYVCVKCYTKGDNNIFFDDIHM